MLSDAKGPELSLTGVARTALMVAIHPPLSFAQDDTRFWNVKGYALLMIRGA